MPVFDTGYFMQQEHIQPFVQRKHDEDEDTTLALVGDIGEWWLDLPRDIQKKTPLLGLHIPEGKNYYDGVIWFRTRRTAALNMDSVNEIEADKIIKRRFLEAIGPKFDENQLVFFVQPWNGRW